MNTIVNRYIKAKKAWTNCKGVHMRQVCGRCKYYDKCSVYKEYIESWMKLQEISKAYNERDGICFIPGEGT